MRQTFLLCLLLLNMMCANAGDTARVLFIGNSYTAYNNLPQLVTDVAASAGDVVIADVNAPGGTTFQMHSTNATTLSKIAQGTWNYVALQEQSQLPSFPDAQIETDMYPYARMLDSLIRVANPCTETIFYMTWGRKNGDASNCPVLPPVCTYSGMDSLLRLRYQIMADTNDAILSPVGAVWRKLRNASPSINLYDADESHPSLAGSYAAACTFYAAIFAKDPTAITSNAGVPATDAAAIRAAAKAVVFDSLSYWKIGTYSPPIWCGGPTGINNPDWKSSVQVHVQAGAVHIAAAQALANGTTIIIRNMESRAVAKQTVQSATTNVIMPLNVVSGMYTVDIVTPEKQRLVQKILL